MQEKMQESTKITKEQYKQEYRAITLSCNINAGNSLKDKLLKLLKYLSHSANLVFTANPSAEDLKLANLIPDNIKKLTLIQIPMKSLKNLLSLEAMRLF